MLSTKLKEAAGNSADATLYVDDVFSTYLYTGNGSTQTITNGIDLAGKGGMVWQKRRNIGGDHILGDTARGVNKAILTDYNGAEFTGSQYVNAFNSDGFTFGYDQGINKLNDTYVSWTFRKAAKFFDVVTYTGTGSARTIAHSLGVAPGMVIVKRTDTTGNWQVYSNELTSAAYSIQLNLTAAQASAPTVWNSTAPTSSVFSVGTDATVNASGSTYVAYLYAHDTSPTGIIQCGSFTTDGSGNATVTLGWEPQYVMMKRTDTTSPWYLVDTMRGWDKSIFNWLSANDSSSTSTTNTYAGSPTATGFVVGDGSGQFPASATYIYMAIRRPNKPPTSGTQVFKPYNTTSVVSNLNTLYDAGFTVDFSMQRNKNGSDGWYLGARLTGTYYLKSETTAAEASSIQLIWDSNIASSGYNSLYGLYQFQRATGFFDVVCYTGTGSATTQAHNLGAVPEMIIVKPRNAVDNWCVYTPAIGITYVAYLNWVDAKYGPYSPGLWNNTTPTASVFSLSGSGWGVNNSAVTYVAYLFATLAGISKVGSYTGNGTGQAIACGFSAGARFVLIKRTDSTGDWYTFDSARGLTSGSSPYLLLNSTAAEVTGNNGVYQSTGGFTLGSTASTTTNINAATYIFLAVA